MRELVHGLLGIAVGGVWCISVLVIGALHTRVTRNYYGWKEWLSWFVAFALLGLCTVLAVHFFSTGIFRSGV
jgi:hypothetical protein